MVLDKKNAALAPKEESVADILSAIKDIVEGGSSNNNTVNALDSAVSNDDELLELTDVVEEFPNAPSASEANMSFSSQPVSSSVQKSVDILDQIDSVLSDNNNRDQDNQNEMLKAVKEEIIHEYHLDEPAVVSDQIDHTLDNIIEPEAIIEEEPAKIELEVAVTAPSTVFEALKSANSPKTDLLSADKAKKSSLAIKNLLENIPKHEIISPSMRNGTTIEDIVVESMKPLLKEWLDQNLETIVRDIVEREIKKLIPKEE